MAFRVGQRERHRHVVAGPFLGLGAAPGPEAEAPTEPEREKTTRPLWLMLLPCALLRFADLCPASWAEHASLWAVVASEGLAAAVSTPDLPSLISGLVSVVVALSLAALALGRARWPGWLRMGGEATAAMVRPLRDLHSGLVVGYSHRSDLGIDDTLRIAGMRMTYRRSDEGAHA